MTLAQLREVAVGVGLPAYAARQMADWLYRKRVDLIADMTNISLAKRQLLETSYEVGSAAPAESVRSIDGTVKYLFSTGKQRAVESVFIPAENRATLCVSSQV